MKTVYQVSQKFSTETETEEISVKEFDNYQDAKDYFEEIKHETQQGGDIVTDLVKYVYDEDEEIDWELSDEDLETFCNPYNYEQHYGKLVIMYMHTETETEEISVKEFDNYQDAKTIVTGKQIGRAHV